MYYLELLDNDGYGVIALKQYCAPTFGRGYAFFVSSDFDLEGAYRMALPYCGNEDITALDVYVLLTKYYT